MFYLYSSLINLLSLMSLIYVHLPLSLLILRGLHFSRGQVKIFVEAYKIKMLEYYITRHNILFLMLIFYYIFKGVEGYLLYRALIIVFDTGNVKRLLLYIICYGIPVFVSVLTLLVWIIQTTLFDHEYNYHMKDDTICWLDGSYLYAGFYPVLIVMLCFNMFILI